MRLELDATVSAPPLQADATTRKHDESVDLGEARSSLNQGIKAAQSGNRVQARALLLRATELDPQNENAWLWLASISEYPEELLGFLNHVLDINPENQRAVEWKAATNSLLAKTFVQRGIDAVHEGQRDFAAECFQTALEHDDRNAVAWMWMASLSISKEVKVELLERAVSSDPQNDEARDALDAAKASIRRDRMVEAKEAAVGGRKEDAMRILDSLLAVEPTSIEAWTMRSHLADSFEEKIQCFENILEIDPENIAAKAGRESLLALFGTAFSPSEPANVADTNVAEAKETGANMAEAHMAEVAVAEANVAEADVNYAGVSAADVEEADVAESKVADVNVAESNPVSSNADEARDSVTSLADSFAETFVERTPPTDGDDLWANSVNPFEYPAEATVGETENETWSHEEPADAYAPPVEEFAAVDVETGRVEPHLSEEEYEQPHVAESRVADPQAETVEFSYAELYSVPSHDEPQRENVEMRSDPEIPMPEVDLPPFAPNSEADAAVDPQPVMVPEVQASACPFCGNVNGAHEVTCGQCMAVLTVSDLELLLANQNADKAVIRHAVDDMERQRLLRSLDSDELVTLGIGHLNLRNLQFGFTCLSDASRMSPNDVVLAGQVNELHIRLEEIKAQEEAHLRMPKGKSILVVDDSPTVRKLIAGKLEKCGHDVICANDGVEAMERLENLVPDLVLLDINMPRMDGYQVCKHIRSNDKTKNVTVVMISGKDGFFDKVRGRMAGTTGYITKPFGPETLMKAVEMYLSGEIPEHDEL